MCWQDATPGERISVCVNCSRAPEGGEDEGYYRYYAPMTYRMLPDGPQGYAGRMHRQAKHTGRPAGTSLLPQATWDGAQMRTSRCTPHHKVHTSSATHGITLHQRHCQLLVRLP
jgi:hypothetical protein